MELLGVRLWKVRVHRRHRRDSPIESSCAVADEGDEARRARPARREISSCRTSEMSVEDSLPVHACHVQNRIRRMPAGLITGLRGVDLGVPDVAAQRALLHRRLAPVGGRGAQRLGLPARQRRLSPHLLRCIRAPRAAPAVHQSRRGGSRGRRQLARARRRRRARRRSSAPAPIDRARRRLRLRASRTRKAASRA